MPAAVRRLVVVVDVSRRRGAARRLRQVPVVVVRVGRGRAAVPYRRYGVRVRVAVPAYV